MGLRLLQAAGDQAPDRGLRARRLAQRPGGWILEKFWAWTDCDGHPENVLGRDELLDNVMLYWINGNGASSARIYWESFARALAQGRDSVRLQRLSEGDRAAGPSLGQRRLYRYPPLGRTRQGWALRRIRGSGDLCRRYPSLLPAIPLVMATGEEPYAGLAELAADGSPEEVIAVYDQWASSYNEDLAKWRYEVPARLANAVLAMEGNGAPAQPILDAGCGTGLIGIALAAGGIETITGIDASTESLTAAGRTGAYHELIEVNLDNPLPFATATFAAVVCGGVIGYVADAGAVLRELVRVTSPGGSVFFTERSDFWVERGYETTLATLARSTTSVVESSEPQPYLPGHPDFGTSIEVIYTTITKPK